MARDAITFRGFNEVDRALASLPTRTAAELQRVLVKQLIEVKKEIAKTSTMSPTAKRALRARDGLIKIRPSKRVQPKRLSKVFGAIFSTWLGGRENREAAAIQIETQVGERVFRPKRARGLLIPAGVMVTPTGRPKRKAKKKIDIAKIPGTRWVRTPNGVLLVRETATKTGKRRRTEILAVLARKARITARLRFFDSWEALATKRTRQFGSLLDKLIRRF